MSQQNQKKLKKEENKRKFIINAFNQKMIFETGIILLEHP
jgi:hypothetical protein